MTFQSNSSKSLLQKFWSCAQDQFLMFRHNKKKKKQLKEIGKFLKVEKPYTALKVLVFWSSCLLFQSWLWSCHPRLQGLTLISWEEIYPSWSDKEQQHLTGHLNSKQSDHSKYPSLWNCPSLFDCSSFFFFSSFLTSYFQVNFPL